MGKPSEVQWSRRRRFSVIPTVEGFSLELSLYFWLCNFYLLHIAKGFELGDIECWNKL